MTPLLLIQQALKQRSKATELDAIDRIAARLDPQLRKRFLAAVRASRKAVDLEALANAIQAGDVSQAALAAKLQEWPEKYGELAFDLRAGFIAGADYSYQVLDGAQYNLRFDLINPHAVKYSNMHLPQIVESYKDNARQIIRDIISDAVSGKYTPQSAAKEIRDHIGLTDRYSRAVARYREELKLDGLHGDALEAKVGKYSDKLLRSRAKTIARTEIIQAQVEGQRALWSEAANNGLFNPLTAKRVWKAHQDERTCPVCMDLDGQEIKFDGIYAGGFAGPPAHPNCIQKDTHVSGAILAGTRMLYSGSTRNIITRSGKSLTITPNHPVMTVGGMQPAGLLNKGDNLLAYSIHGESNFPSAISGSFSAARFLSPLDVQDAPSTAKQIFETLLRVSSSRIITQRTGLEFHGDALRGDGNIEIVRLDRPLRFNISDVERSEERTNLALVSSCRPMPGQSSVNLVNLCARHSFAISRNAGDTAALPSQQSRLGSRAYFDAACAQLSAELESRDATFAGQLIERFPETVLLDEIIEIHDSYLHEYVYDFQTISGLIVAQGLLISNCRCSEDLLP